LRKLAKTRCVQGHGGGLLLLVLVHSYQL